MAGFPIFCSFVCIHNSDQAIAWPELWIHTKLQKIGNPAIKYTDMYFIVVNVSCIMHTYNELWYWFQLHPRFCPNQCVSECLSTCQMIKRNHCVVPKIKVTSAQTGSGTKYPEGINIEAQWCHLATQIWVSIGSGNMACCLMAPSHYLNQCWLIISKVLWHFIWGQFHKRHLSHRDHSLKLACK